MDGRVLAEALTTAAAGSRASTNGVAPPMAMEEDTYSEEESEKVMARLRSLGYVE
jgi:hypothetical protein